MSDSLLDVLHLDELAEGDEVFRSELLRVYLEDTESLLYLIKEQIEQGEFAAVGMTAHSIKGSSANLGARKVSEAAARVEASIKNGVSIDEVQGLLKGLQEAYQMTRPVIEANL